MSFKSKYTGSQIDAYIGTLRKVGDINQSTFNGVIQSSDWAGDEAPYTWSKDVSSLSSSAYGNKPEIYFYSLGNDEKTVCDYSNDSSTITITSNVKLNLRYVISNSLID